MDYCKEVECYAQDTLSDILGGVSCITHFAGEAWVRRTRKSLLKSVFPGTLEELHKPEK